MIVKGCDIKYGKDGQWIPAQIKLGIHNQWKDVYIKGGVNNNWEPKKLPDFNVTLSAGKNIASVIGTGLYELNSNVTVTCNLQKLEEGTAVFEGWYDGTTKVSSDQTYTFTVTKDIKLTAKANIKYTITLTDTYNNSTYGKISINNQDYSGTQTIEVLENTKINFYCSSTNYYYARYATITENGTQVAVGSSQQNSTEIIPAEYSLIIKGDMLITISPYGNYAGRIVIQSIKLTYTFNDTITIPSTAATYTTTFGTGINNTGYTKLIFIAPTSTSTGIMRYYSGYNYNAYSNGKWMNNSYKKITFKTVPPDNLLVWLKANATNSFS